MWERGEEERWKDRRRLRENGSDQGVRDGDMEKPLSPTLQKEKDGGRSDGDGIKKGSQVVARARE